MKEIQKTLKHLAILNGIIFLGVFFNIEVIPFIFPVRHLSTFYFLTLSILLIFYYDRMVVPRKGHRTLMLGIAGMIMLLILLRGIKYIVVAEQDILARYTWYLYYIPILMIPTFLYYLSHLIFEKDDTFLFGKRLWYLLISLLLILLVLTNDLHQQVFQFHPGFAHWDDDYSYGFGFYVIMFWAYVPPIVTLFWLMLRSHISGISKNSWLLLIPIFLGAGTLLLLAAGSMPQINGQNLLQVPEGYCLLSVGVLECCLCLGLIPSNEEHSEMLRISSLAAQITDQNGNIVYKAEDAPVLTREQFNLADGSRIHEHTLIRKMAIPGGYGIWLEDVKELDELNNELYETRKRLAEEMVLVRFRNDLREKQAKVNQRTKLYDAIARKTQSQSRKISELAKRAQHTDQEKIREQNRRQITLLATYIKRYANLMLLSEDHEQIDQGEISLSMAEVFHWLNRCSIPGTIYSSGEGTVPSEAALLLFELFENLLETNFESLKACYVTLHTSGDQCECKINLEGEGMQSPSLLMERAEKAGFTIRREYEDHVLYLHFRLPGGGERS